MGFVALPPSPRSDEFGSGHGDGVPDGGTGPARLEANSFVRLFVQMDHTSAAVEQAESIGATTLIPPQRLPDGAEMAVLHDPEEIPAALTKRAG